MICTVCNNELNQDGSCPRCGADYGGVNVELLRIVHDIEFRVAEVIARLVEGDPHQWSTRPCATCKAISSLLDRPFGCYKKRAGPRSTEMVTRRKP